MRVARVVVCVSVALFSTLFACSAISCRAHNGVHARGETATRRVYFATTMGCRVEITVDEDVDAKARHATRAAMLELDRLDAMLSDWKRTSELSRWNTSGALHASASIDLRTVLARALDIARASEGRFDPTVGGLVSLWRTSRLSGALPAIDALHAARERTGWAMVAVDGESITRTRGDIALDFGGIAKGFAAIRAIEVLREHGCTRGCVAIAGDIACSDAPRGECGWRVSIERAHDLSLDASTTSITTSTAATTSCTELMLVNQAISTSGASMQWIEIGGQRYAHIVDPRTGLGATNLAQVTVVGPPDCAVDALSTALALTESDDEARTILAHFPAFGAFMQRTNGVSALGAWPPSP